VRCCACDVLGPSLICSRWRLMDARCDVNVNGLHRIASSPDRRPTWTQQTTKISSGFTPKYALHPPSEAYIKRHTSSPFTQLTGHVNDLSNIYEHAAFAIRRLHDEKQELLSRADQLEQDNPSAEVRRLRDENSILRARLARAAKEKDEVIRERDALFRKLYSIRQLIDGQAVRQAQLSYSIYLLTTAFPLFRSLMRQIRAPTHRTVHEVRPAPYALGTADTPNTPSPPPSFPRPRTRPSPSPRRT